MSSGSKTTSIARPRRPSGRASGASSGSGRDDTLFGDLTRPISADRQLVRVRPLKPSIPVHLHLLTAAKAPLPQVGRKLVKILAERTQAALAALDA